MSIPATDVHTRRQEIVVAANADTKNRDLVFNRPQDVISGGRRISSTKVKETKEIHDKFDMLLKTIKEPAELKSISEVAAKIPSVSQYIQDISSCTFKKLFFILGAVLKWYDTEDLANICAYLEMSETLEHYKVDAREYLQHRIRSSLAPELVLPGQRARQFVTLEQTRDIRRGEPHETLELFIDGAWDRKAIIEDHDKVCRKIVSILGRPMYETISGTFNTKNSILYINIYR